MEEVILLPNAPVLASSFFKTFFQSNIDVTLKVNSTLAVEKGLTTALRLECCAGQDARLNGQPFVENLSGNLYVAIERPYTTVERRLQSRDLSMVASSAADNLDIFPDIICITKVEIRQTNSPCNGERPCYEITPIVSYCKHTLDDEVSSREKPSDTTSSREEKSSVNGEEGNHGVSRGTSQFSSFSHPEDKLDAYEAAPLDQESTSMHEASLGAVSYFTSTLKIRLPASLQPANSEKISHFLSPVEYTNILRNNLCGYKEFFETETEDFGCLKFSTSAGSFVDAPESSKTNSVCCSSSLIYSIPSSSFFLTDAKFVGDIASSCLSCSLLSGVESRLSPHHLFADHKFGSETLNRFLFNLWGPAGCMYTDELLACQYQEWHSYLSSCLKSSMLQIPVSLMKYLEADEVRLPSFVVRKHSYMNEVDSNSSSSDGFESSNEDQVEDDAHLSSDPTKVREAEEDLARNQEFYNEMELAMQNLGGNVIPRLNWCTPKDAIWMTGSLICSLPSDVLLLLRSSERISKYIDAPFRDCIDAKEVFSDAQLTEKRIHSRFTKRSLPYASKGQDTSFLLTALLSDFQDFPYHSITRDKFPGEIPSCMDEITNSNIPNTFAASECPSHAFPADYTSTGRKDPQSLLIGTATSPVKSIPSTHENPPSSLQKAAKSSMNLPLPVNPHIYSSSVHDATTTDHTPSNTLPENPSNSCHNEPSSDTSLQASPHSIYASPLFPAHTCFPTPSLPTFSHFLIFVKKVNISTHMEFRGFVAFHGLLGISQRNVSSCFSALLNEEFNEKIKKSIVAFFEATMKSFKLERYAFDVYVENRRSSNRGLRCWLMDISPWGDPTDPLLFSWEELRSMAFEEDSKSREKVKTERFALRIVSNEDEVKSSSEGHSRFPLEFRLAVNGRNADENVDVEDILKDLDEEYACITGRNQR